MDAGGNKQHCRVEEGNASQYPIAGDATDALNMKDSMLFGTSLCFSQYKLDRWCLHYLTSEMLPTFSHLEQISLKCFDTVGWVTGMASGL